MKTIIENKLATKTAKNTINAVEKRVDRRINLRTIQEFLSEMGYNWDYKIQGGYGAYSTSIADFSNETEYPWTPFFNEKGLVITAFDKNGKEVEALLSTTITPLNFVVNGIEMQNGKKQIFDEYGDKYVAKKHSLANFWQGFLSNKFGKDYVNNNREVLSSLVAEKREEIDEIDCQLQDIEAQIHALQQQKALLEKKMVNKSNQWEKREKALQEFDKNVDKSNSYTNFNLNKFKKSQSQGFQFNEINCLDLSEDDAYMPTERDEECFEIEKAFTDGTPYDIKEEDLFEF